MLRAPVGASRRGRGKKGVTTKSKGERRKRRAMEEGIADSEGGSSAGDKNEEHNVGQWDEGDVFVAADPLAAMMPYPDPHFYWHNEVELGDARACNEHVKTHPSSNERKGKSVMTCIAAASLTAIQLFL